uniref:NADH-ubiquinone oxidoreductase chain 2 n=1 Tax=Trichodectes canis TaxID=209909 RepID=A0A386B294_9NEOP|nr:NADH dehydrogenase subunit 2 [Trichodectes canis]
MIKMGIYMITLAWSLMLMCSSYSMISVFLAMEVLGFCMLALVISLKSDGTKIRTWGLFVIQSISSMMILICLCLMFTTTTGLMITSVDYGFSVWVMIFIQGICMKIGMPPFHRWMLALVEGITWDNFYLVASLHKLFPILLLQMVSWSVDIFSPLMNLMAMLGLFTAFCGVFEYSLRRFFVYSSILNMSWTLVGSMTGGSLGVMYFVFYLISMLSICVFLVNMKYSTFSNSFLSNMAGDNWSQSVLIMFLFVCLMGLPPFPGFFLKLEIIGSLISSNLGLITSFLLLFSSSLMISSYLKNTFIGLVVSKSQLSGKVMNNSLVLLSMILFMMFMLSFLWFF